MLLTVCIHKMQIFPHLRQTTIQLLYQGIVPMHIEPIYRAGSRFFLLANNAVVANRAGAVIKNLKLWGTGLLGCFLALAVQISSVAGLLQLPTHLTSHRISHLTALHRTAEPQTSICTSLNSRVRHSSSCSRQSRSLLNTPIRLSTHINSRAKRV